ncbi:uncharacterized protein LOC119178408 [Rhipicephalus microplus]|uniref:uncharacterized protein LOC119178408 n=1 Tax=Rhipicephalus microplus TaxID=6941 RepID=UPI003F6D7A9E
MARYLVVDTFLIKDTSQVEATCLHPRTFSGTDEVDVDDWIADYERISALNRYDLTLMLVNVLFYLKGKAKVVATYLVGDMFLVMDTGQVEATCLVVATYLVVDTFLVMDTAPVEATCLVVATYLVGDMFLVMDTGQVEATCLATDQYPPENHWGHPPHRRGQSGQPQQRAPVRPPRRVSTFTLICVFEYLQNVIPRNTPQCTDYVYIRFFTYSYRVNQEPLKFEHIKQMDGAAKLYYDETPSVWRKLRSYRALDNYVKISQRYFPDSRWFLGIWGSTFSRLMASLWDGDVFRKALRATLRSNFSEKLTMSDFNGFAVINTIIQDTRILGRAKSFGEAFRAANEPILEPDWIYIHTAAIWPGGNSRVPEAMVFDVMRDANVVGVSTSNTTDENNIILGRAGGNVSPYKAASPPNPLKAVAPGTRGMLDILDEFQYWKQVLNRQSLCFSLTTSINYMRSSADPIDFVNEVHNDEDVQRFGRERFTTRGRNNLYPVEDKQTSYYFDNKTYSHFWRYVSNGKLLTLFAYDTGSTLAYKVNEMLKAYGKDKCVVLDDLSDDDVQASFTYAGHTVSFGKFEILTAVQSVMKRLYGGPFP